MKHRLTAQLCHLRLALTPVIWLAIVGLCLVVTLYGVGYIAAGEEMPDTRALATELAGLPKLVARQAALAQSGVTMGITLALCITCIYWAWSARRGQEKEGHRGFVFGVVLACFAVAFGGLLLLDASAAITPFASSVGKLLLDPATSRVNTWLASLAPFTMYVLACVVPAVLACGASFLLIPIKTLKDAAAAQANHDLLLDRLKEMDQLLYIGALTLVFGILQLSAAMSVPLAGAPVVAEVKAELEPCKPAPQAALGAPAQGKAEPPGGGHTDPSPAQCRKAMERMQQAARVEELRHVVKGITFCFGLAFSALLAAIYVPGAMVLRNYLEAPLAHLKANGSTAKADKPAGADIDPINRIAAIVATLSPLLAGVLASAIPT